MHVVFTSYFPAYRINYYMCIVIIWEGFILNFKKHAVTSKVKKTGHFEKKTCHEHFKRIIATRLNDTWSHVMCKKKYANFAARSHVYKSMDGIKKNIFKIRLENYRGGIFFAWSMNAPVGTDIFMPRMFFDT